MATQQKTRRQRKGPKSLGETLASWEALSTTAKAQLADNPQAAADQASFDAVIAQIKQANAEQEALTAKLRDSIRNRQSLQQQGRKLRNHVASHLQSKLGPESELLREFGLRPKGRRVRRKSSAGDPSTSPQPTPAPTPGPELHKP